MTADSSAALRNDNKRTDNSRSPLGMTTRKAKAIAKEEEAKAIAKEEKIEATAKDQIVMR
jgi:hypothetical protein